MKLIVGLGNPESQYTGTRHNIGFDAVEKIADSFRAEFKKGKGKYLAAKITHQTGAAHPHQTHDLYEPLRPCGGSCNEFL